MALVWKAETQAKQIYYAFFLLAGKETAQATFVGQVCASLLLCSAELQKGSQGYALAFKKRVKYLKKKSLCHFVTYCISVPFH